MNLPQVYMCSPSWTLLPPPTFNIIYINKSINAIPKTFMKPLHNENIMNLFFQTISPLSICIFEWNYPFLCLQTYIFKSFLILFFLDIRKILVMKSISLLITNILFFHPLHLSSTTKSKVFLFFSNSLSFHSPITTLAQTLITASFDGCHDLLTSFLAVNLWLKV